MFVLQAIFHNMFHGLANDIGHHAVSREEYGLEFANDGVFLIEFIRFWYENQFCRVFLKRTGQMQAELTLLAIVMVVFSTGPHIVCQRHSKHCPNCSAVRQ